MPAVSESRYLVQAGWDDVPHLGEKAKRELKQSIPSHEYDARVNGIPALGSGAIYPLKAEEITFEPMRDIPPFWKRVYGLDVGWKKTAAVWGAWDEANDIVYIYTEHYQGQQVPSVHAEAIKARGAWIPGVVDPASAGASVSDGQNVLGMYRALGLKLMPADNSVEAGIYAVYQRLATGRLKISTACRNLLAEYNMYRRDENGKIVKDYDHALDALRYLVMSGLRLARQVPVQPRAIGAGIGDDLVQY